MAANSSTSLTDHVLARVPNDRLLPLTHVVAAAWFAVAGLASIAVGHSTRASDWLWFNPVAVIVLIFALSVASLQALPRLARWHVGSVALATAVHSIALGVAAEAVFARYLHVPAAPTFIAASAQLALLALIESRQWVGEWSTASKVFAASIAAGLTAIAPIAFLTRLSHTAALAVLAGVVVTALLAVVDLRRARALANIARDRSPRYAVVRTAALLVFDLVYLPALLPRQLVRRR